MRLPPEVTETFAHGQVNITGTGTSDLLDAVDAARDHGVITHLRQDGQVVAMITPMPRAGGLRLTPRSG